MSSDSTIISIYENNNTAHAYKTAEKHIAKGRPKGRRTCLDSAHWDWFFRELLDQWYEMRWSGRVNKERTEKLKKMYVPKEEKWKLIVKSQAHSVTGRGRKQIYVTALLCHHSFTFIHTFNTIPLSLSLTLTHPSLSLSLSRSHRFGRCFSSSVPIPWDSGAGGTWAAILTETSRFSNIHTAVLAESLSAVWELG